MAEDTETHLDGRNGKAPWQNMNKVFLARTAQEHAKHLLPHLQPNSRILDVGCGLGSITLGLADLVPQGYVIGIDSNPTTTEAAKQEAKARGTSNIDFQVADIHDLSAFEAESFDIIHAHQVLLHVPNPVNAIKQLRRLLKPSGLLSTRDNTSMGIYPPDPILTNTFEAFRKFAAERGATFFGGTCHHVWVHKAGFEWEKMRVEQAAWGYTTREERLMWTAGVNGTTRPKGPNDKRTAEDIEEVKRHWNAWAEKDEAKLYAIDGVVLAWK